MWLVIRSVKTNPSPMRVICPLIVAISLLSFPCIGTHLKSVEITVTPVDCVSNTYQITVTAYVAPGLVYFGSEQSLLSFGDGETMKIPEQEPVLIDSYNKVLRVQF